MQLQIASCCCTQNPPAPTPTTIKISAYMLLCGRRGKIRQYQGQVGSVNVPYCLNPTIPPRQLQQTPSYDCFYREYYEETPFDMQTGYPYYSQQRTSIVEVETRSLTDHEVTFTKSSSTLITTTAAVYWGTEGSNQQSGISTAVQNRREVYTLPGGSVTYQRYVASAFGNGTSDNPGQGCRECGTMTGANQTKTGLSVTYNAQGTYRDGIFFTVSKPSNALDNYTVAVTAGSLVINKNGNAYATFVVNDGTVKKLIEEIDNLTDINASASAIGGLNGVIGLSTGSNVQNQTIQTITTLGVPIYLRKPGSPWEPWQSAVRPNYSFAGTNAWGVTFMWLSGVGTPSQFASGFSSFVPTENLYQVFNGMEPQPQVEIYENTASPYCYSIPPITTNYNCGYGVSGAVYGMGGNYAWDISNYYWTVRPINTKLIEYEVELNAGSTGSTNNYTPNICNFGGPLMSFCFTGETSRSWGLKYSWILRRY